MRNDKLEMRNEKGKKSLAFLAYAQFLISHF